MSFSGPASRGVGKIWKKFGKKLRNLVLFVKSSPFFYIKFKLSQQIKRHNQLQLAKLGSTPPRYRFLAPSLVFLTSFSANFWDYHAKFEEKLRIFSFSL